MTVDITARHFSPSSKLQELVHDKVGNIQKYHENITSCHVVLLKEQNSEDIEIIARAKGKEFVAKESSDLFEKSLNSAVDKIVRQLKKHHDKVYG
ncbi:MAG: ribosome-associated translation inhibitor RaiA [FCB group bacterium]|nr:ribosome-associated translation inhibitor RaiA [FCB group bacterium]